MRLLLVFVLFAGSLSAVWDFDGKIGTFYQQNIQTNTGKDPWIADFRANLKFKHDNEAGDVAWLFDFDTIFDPVDSNRRYFLPTEAKVKVVKEDYDVEAGIIVLSWGVMDFFSPVDSFNSRNILKDPLNAEKLGTLGIKYNYYLDNSEWDFVIKIIEVPLWIPYVQSPYFIFDSSAVFNDDFSAINFFRPTFFIKYNSTYEGESTTIDYGVIASNGLDTLRGLTPSYDAATSSILMTPLVFYSTKLMGYVAVPLDSYLLKSELVTGLSESSAFSHYAQLSMAVEKSSEIFGTKALTLLMEYHKLFFFEAGKYNDRDLFQLFQNDIVLGGRIGFNDKYNSALTLGGIIDIDYSEYAMFIDYTSKLSDAFGFTIKAAKAIPTQLSSLYTLPSSSISLDRYNTVFKGLGDFSSISMLLTYSF